MVKIKEIAEDLDQMSGLFWGVAMQGGKRYSQKVVTPFHIAMAALEPGSAGDEDVGNGIVTVWLGIKGFDYLLCTLKHDSIFNVALDYELDVGEELDLFINGKGTVYLTGYLRIEDNPPMDDWQDYDEEGETESVATDEDTMFLDSEDSEDEDEEEEEESDDEIVPIQKKRKKSNVKIVELNDSPKKSKKGEASKPTGAKDAKKNAKEPAQEEVVDAPVTSASAKKKKKKNKKKNKNLSDESTAKKVEESAAKEAVDGKEESVSPEAAAGVAPPVAETKESADATAVAAASDTPAPDAPAPKALAPVVAADAAPYAPATADAAPSEPATADAAPSELATADTASAAPATVDTAPAAPDTADTAPAAPATADTAPAASASEDKSGELEKTVKLENGDAPAAAVEKLAEEAAKQHEEKEDVTQHCTPMDTSSATENAASAEVATQEADKAAPIAEVAKEEKNDSGASAEIPAAKLDESKDEPSENGGDEPSKSKKKKNKKKKNKDVDGSADDESKKRKNEVSASESPSKKSKTVDGGGGGGGGGEKTLKLPGGLVIHEQKDGSGDVAKKGAVCMIKYTGRLKSNNKVFDSNAGPRESPLKIVVGKGEVIQGFDEGVEGMKVGGKRRLVIPAHKAYGKQSPSREIPPNSALIFDIELVKMAGKKK